MKLTTRGRAWRKKESALSRESLANPPAPINYATCKIEPVEYAKAVFGARLKFIQGSYYLDGKRVLAQHLEGLAKAETVPELAPEPTSKTPKHKLPEQEFMSRDEVFDAVGIHSTYIYKLLKSGEFPPKINIRVAGRTGYVYWRTADIQAWLDGKRTWGEEHV